MAIRLEPRGKIAQGMMYASPLVALLATIISGFVLFAILGVDPIKHCLHSLFRPSQAWTVGRSYLSKQHR